ncbi:UNVERIFIED_CONTAM: hypothetical protein FKN15_078143 [Acipenser sinensis]
MAKSQTIEKYCELAIQLQRVELEIMSREEKLSFFINIYKHPGHPRAHEDRLSEKHVAELFQWILNHMGNSPKKKELDALLQAASYTVVYLPYDWSTNGKD